MAARDGCEDDTEPEFVSKMLRSRLQQNRLSFLEPILKHGCNVSTFSLASSASADLSCSTRASCPSVEINPMSE